MPYKTQYGSHYHMIYGCHGATIPCDTNGLTPCSDCCGGDHDTSDGGSVGSSSGGVGSPAGASSGGEFAAGSASTDVASQDIPTDTVTSFSEPTPEDMSDAADALDMMGELYATGQVTAPDPSLLGRLAETRKRAAKAVSTGFAIAKGRLTDACSRLGGALSTLRGIASPGRGKAAKGSRPLVQKLGAVTAALAFSLSMTGCGTAAFMGEDLSTAEQYTAAQAIHQMESAEDLTLRKANISLGDRWDVYAGDYFVATIDGEAIYLVGDTYTLRSTNGEFIASEQEDFSVVFDRATKLDADGNEVGRYDEEFSFLHHRIGFTDADGNATGSMESRIWPPTVKNHAEIMDADGDVAWDYSEDWLTFDNATIHLDRRDGADDVEIEDAVMGSAMFHEQTEPRGGSGSGSGSSGKSTSK